MTKQCTLRDGWECAKSLQGRIRHGRRTDTYSTEKKEEMCLHIYRYMLACWVNRWKEGAKVKDFKPYDLYFLFLK